MHRIIIRRSRLWTVNQVKTSRLSNSSISLINKLKHTSSMRQAIVLFNNISSHCYRNKLSSGIRRIRAPGALRANLCHHRSKKSRTVNSICPLRWRIKFRLLTNDRARKIAGNRRVISSKYNTSSRDRPLIQSTRLLVRPNSQLSISTANTTALLSIPTLHSR